MNRWIDVLDHGDDPGRFTIVQGNGQIMTVNENGSLVFRRKCHNPFGVVRELSREPGVRTLKPALVPDLLKKAGLVEDPEPVIVVRQSPAKRLSDEVKAQLIAYARKKWPYGDNYHARLSQNGNYVVGYTNDYPLQHGAGEEQTLTPVQYQDLDTILDKPLSDNR